MKSNVKKANYNLLENQAKIKKKPRKFQTIIKDKIPLLRKDIRKRENDINLELKQKITKSENQIQQLKQEKEKWWKNIWTIIVSFGRRNRKNEIQEKIDELEESIKNEKIAVDLFKYLLKRDIVKSTNNLAAKVKIKNLTNKNNRLKTELRNAKVKTVSSKDLLEKNKIELSNKLTKADNTDKINTSLKDTALSIVSDEKNIISVLTNAGSMFADYILKPKKGTPSKEECSLQVNWGMSSKLCN